jgi:hypothetical protein
MSQVKRTLFDDGPPSGKKPKSDREIGISFKIVAKYDDNCIKGVCKLHHVCKSKTEFTPEYFKLDPAVCDRKCEIHHECEDRVCLYKHKHSYFLLVLVQSSALPKPFLVSRSESDFKSWKLTTMEIVDGNNWVVKGRDYAQSNLIHFSLQQKIDEQLDSLPIDPSIVEYLYDNKVVIDHILDRQRQLLRYFDMKMTPKMKDLFPIVLHLWTFKTPIFMVS